MRDVGPLHSRGVQISEYTVPATEELALQSKRGLAILECKYCSVLLMFVLAVCGEILL